MSVVLHKPSIARRTLSDAPTIAIQTGADSKTRGAGAAGGSEAVPDERWSLARLTERAVEEGARIERGEVSVTARYWYLGKALNAAKGHFRRGTWQPYLEKCQITLDRARAARALAETFPSPDALAGLTLRRALLLAKREKTTPTAARLLRNLDARLAKALKAARALRAHLSTPNDRAALAKTIERTTRAFKVLARDCLKGQRR